MQCLGEMIAHLPVSGGHITLARRFVGNDMAFAVGELLPRLSVESREPYVRQFYRLAILV